MLVAKYDTVGEFDGYFKELDATSGEIVYVFLTGINNQYMFGNNVLSLANNNGYVTLNAAANGFVANKPGAFDMTITALDGSSRTVKCRVETRVSSLDSNRKDDDAYAQNFQNGIQTVIAAGVKNISPDVVMSGILNNISGALSLWDVPMTITVEYLDGDTYVDAGANDWYYVGGVINFADDYVGKQVRITFAPEYALSTDSGLKVELVYMLNDGVNVYDSNELYDAFADLSVKTVNILREIKAVMNRDQLLNGDPNAPLNQGFRNGVYVRSPLGDESFTINGNCYMIDASDIPLLDPNNGGLHQDKYCAETPYYYLNVHSGIFTYNAITASNTANSTNVTYLNVNDLYIHGNFDGSYGNLETNFKDPVSGATGWLLKGSCTYNGIDVRNGHLTITNSRIDHTNVALHMDGHDGGSYLSTPTRLHTSAVLDGVQLDVTFAQSLYAWGQVGVEVDSSYIGQSSGASFHFADTPVHKDYAENTGYLRVSTDTVINNFVTANSAWFNAFQKTPLAAYLLAEVNGGLAPMGLAITKNDASGNEFFNFVLMYESAGSRFTDVGGDMGPTITDEESSNGQGTHVPSIRTYYGDELSEEYRLPVVSPLWCGPYLDCYAVYLEKRLSGTIGDSLGILIGAYPIGTPLETE